MCYINHFVSKFICTGQTYSHIHTDTHTKNNKGKNKIKIKNKSNQSLKYDWMPVLLKLRSRHLELNNIWKYVTIQVNTSVNGTHVRMILFTLSNISKKEKKGWAQCFPRLLYGFYFEINYIKQRRVSVDQY